MTAVEREILHGLRWLEVALVLLFGLAYVREWPWDDLLLAAVFLLEGVATVLCFRKGLPDHFGKAAGLAQTVLLTAIWLLLALAELFLFFQ